MDRDRFDALARLLATKGSRRGALGALFGAALFGQDPDDGLAKPGKKKKQRRGEGQRKGSGRDKGKGKGRGQDKGRSQNKGRKEKSGRQRAQAEAIPAGCCSAFNCTPGPGKNLQKCCYEGQNLAGQNFTGANLENANFKGANLSGANFSGANLSKACFVDADLTGVTFNGSTNLNGAVFCPTQTDSGLDNSGCTRGTACCETCPGPCPVNQRCCPNGACQECCNNRQCPEGERCVNGTCACNAASCPDGCCDTPTGPCIRPGNANENCGSDGAICRDCTATQATPVCVNGQCVCPAPRVVCNNICCTAGQICDTRPDPDRCCTPETLDQTCGVGPARRCGQVTNNCGQPVDCGACAPVTCRVVACTGPNNTCAITGNQPDRTTCTTAAGGQGICCNGTCVAGVCCANSDCTGATNTCINNQCRCGMGPACTEPNETCCGTTPQGICINTTIDPNNCGRCGNVCPNGNCVAGECAPCTSTAQCGPNRVCCGGQCFAGICCAFAGPCRPHNACCNINNLPPDRSCCVGPGGGRCCLRNATAAEIIDGQPFTRCVRDSDCCVGICSPITGLCDLIINPSTCP